MNPSRLSEFVRGAPFDASAEEVFLSKYEEGCVGDDIDGVGRSEELG